MTESTLETVIPFPESAMRLSAVCPTCRTAFIGFESRKAIEAVVVVHDIECPHLAEVRKMLTKPEDEPGELAAAEAAITAGYEDGIARIRAMVT